MRLAILSDIHGNLLALQAVLDDLKQAGGADKTWVLGDLCAFGPRPAECLQLVRDIPQVEVIGGNTERYVVMGQFPGFTGETRPKDAEQWRAAPGQMLQSAENIAWTMSKLSFADYEYLAKLHHRLEVEIPAYGWAIGYHAVPGDDETRLLPDTPVEEALDHFLDAEGRIGFGGHTHLPMDRDLGRWRVVNVGSVGLPRDEARASYVVMTFEQGAPTVEFRRVAFDTEAIFADLRQQGHPAADFIAQSFAHKTL
ncbi:MAG TPA: metallophosphoesterase family protein [Aggregatilineales bacterium]|nr:metallophosphoesterase family protein [Aggregatilineales bacterium]